MIDIFLSASVPLPTRHREFFETADVLLIREAIKALVEVVLPNGRITFGGHPAITPLISLFIRDADLSPDRLTIFQSQFFASEFPVENSDYLDIRIVPASAGREASLLAMREAMLSSRRFSAAVLIGGMEGIYEELAVFRRLHPNAAILPIASTGAAAAIVHKDGRFETELAEDLTYASLFRRRLLPLDQTTRDGL